MIHFVYETTNTVNGMTYTGVHSTHKSIENDKYLGSGLWFLKAKKRYGSEVFTRRVLAICETREEALRLEGEIANKETVERLRSLGLTYNLCAGGSGRVNTDNKRTGRKHSEGTKAKISASLSGRRIGNRRPGWKPSEESRARMSEARVGRYSGAEHPNAKPVEIDGIAFVTILSAVEHLNVAKTTVYKWLKSGKHGARYL